MVFSLSNPKSTIMMETVQGAFFLLLSRKGMKSLKCFAAIVTTGQYVSMSNITHRLNYLTSTHLDIITLCWLPRYWDTPQMALLQLMTMWNAKVIQLTKSKQVSGFKSLQELRCLKNSETVHALPWTLLSSTWLRDHISRRKTTQHMGRAIYNKVLNIFYLNRIRTAVFA